MRSQGGRGGPPAARRRDRLNGLRIAGKGTQVGQLPLSAEQSAVFELIENTREHVFVTGRAGTGKSTLLNHLSWNTEKQLVISAPTGVAALNVGGQTIHSLFRLPIGVIADHDIDQSAELRKLLNTIDTLVIDEISMVNADLMDAIDRSLRQARQRPLRGVRRRAGGAVRRPVPARAGARATPTSAPTSATPTARCGSSTRRCGARPSSRSSSSPRSTASTRPTSRRC